MKAEKALKNYWYQKSKDRTHGNKNPTSAAAIFVQALRPSIQDMVAKYVMEKVLMSVVTSSDRQNE